MQFGLSESQQILKNNARKFFAAECPMAEVRRLMETVRSGRVDLTPLLTHRFSLDEIVEAYKIFGSRGDGVLKVAIKP